MSKQIVGESRKREYEQLVLKEKHIDEELKKWEQKANQTNEMELLHKYNEVKDAAQILLGAIGNVEGVTIRKLHETFQLPLSD